MCALAYTILATVLLRLEGKDSEFARAVGNAVKERGSLAAYIAAVLIALVAPIVSLAIYFAVAVVWFVPDRRIERRLG